MALSMSQSRHLGRLQKSEESLEGVGMKEGLCASRHCTPYMIT